MAKSNAIAGIGTKFSRWDESTSAFVEMSEVVSIGGPSKSRESIEVTHLTSPDGYKEFISGLRESGTVPLGMNFTPETYDLLDEDFHNDDPVSYQIEFPDGSTFEFEAFVTELTTGVDTGDKISADVTLQITGKVETSLTS